MVCEQPKHGERRIPSCMLALLLPLIVGAALPAQVVDALLHLPSATESQPKPQRQALRMSDTETLADAKKLAQRENKLVLVVDFPVVPSRAEKLAQAERAFQYGTWNDPAVRSLCARHYISHVRYYDVATHLHFTSAKRGRAANSAASPFPLPQPVSFVLMPDGQLVHLIAGHLSADQYRAFLQWALETVAQSQRNGDATTDVVEGIQVSHRDMVSAMDNVFAERFRNHADRPAGTWTADLASEAVSEAWWARFDWLSRELAPTPQQFATDSLALWIAANYEFGPNPGHYLLAGEATCPFALLERGAVEVLGHQWIVTTSAQRVETLVKNMTSLAEDKVATVATVFDNRLPRLARETTLAERLKVMEHPSLRRRMKKCEVVEMSWGELSLLTEMQAEAPVEIEQENPLAFVVFNRQGERIATVAEANALVWLRRELLKLVP